MAVPLEQEPGTREHGFAVDQQEPAGARAGSDELRRTDVDVEPWYEKQGSQESNPEIRLSSDDTIDPPQWYPSTGVVHRSAESEMPHAADAQPGRLRHVGNRILELLGMRR